MYARLETVKLNHSARQAYSYIDFKIELIYARWSRIWHTKKFLEIYAMLEFKWRA